MFGTYSQVADYLKSNKRQGTPTKFSKEMPRAAKRQRRGSKGAVTTQSKLRMTSNSTVSLRSAPTYRFVKHICTSSIPITYKPLTGFTVSGLTDSINLGIACLQTGFFLYNPSIGPSITAGYSYNDASSFSNIFDQFRVAKVRVRGFFSNNISNVTSVTTCMPIIYSAVDLDGGVVNAWTTEGALLTYDNAQVHQPNTRGVPFMDRSFVPNVLISSSTNTLTTSRQFLDTGATGASAAWYGMFIQIDNQGATQATSEGDVTLVVDIMYEYKNVR